MPRDPGPPSDAPRGPKGLPTSTDLRLRHERLPSTSSSPMSPAFAMNMNIDPSNAAKAIGQVFMDFIEDVEQVSQLAIHKMNLEKVVKMRETEHTKAMEQHHELPSVPDLQKKFKTRDTKQLKELDETLKRRRAKAVKNTEKMGHLLVAALPLVEMKKSVKEIDDRPQKAEMEALQEQLREFKTQFAQYQDASRQEHATLQDQVKELQTQLAKNEETKAENVTLRGEVEETKTELAGLKKAFIDEVSEMQKQQANLQTQQTQSNGELESVKQKVTELSAANEQLEAKNNEFQTQIDLVQAEKGEIQSRLSNLEAQVGPLADQVATLQQELSTLQEKANAADVQADIIGKSVLSLQTGMESNSQQLVQHDQKVQNLEGKLLNVDFDALDEISENWTFEWPDIKITVGSIQKTLSELTLSELPQLKTAVEGIHEKLEKQPHSQPVHHAAQVAPAAPAAPTIQNARQAEANEEEMIAKISTNVMGKVNILIDGLITQVSSMVDKVKEAVRDLSGRLAAAESLELEERVKTLESLREQVTKTIEGFSTDLEDKTNALTLQISVLDSRYNNLSTKDVCEQIVAQINQMSPTPHQIATDLTALDSKVQQIQRQVTDLTAGSVAKEYNTKNISTIEDVHKDWHGGTKRRRVGSDANGVLQSVNNTG